MTDQGFGRERRRQWIGERSRAAAQTPVAPSGQDVRDVGFSAPAGLLSILAFGL